jgi:NADPH2:quinone reductase
MMATMRAVRLEEFGGPDVLVARDVDTPEPAPGEVLVRLSASGVNFVDIYHRTGRYQVPLPFVPGVEGVGVVTAVGAGVTEPAVGRRVGWVNRPGTYAENATVPADEAIPLPDGMTDETAAAVLLQGITAQYLTHSCHAVRPGEDILVHAAAGGTGALITQVATALGARVIGTVSTPEKENVAREAGAAEIIRYAEGVDDVPRRVRELTGGRGVAAVYDGVGAATFEASLASLSRRGTLVYFGAASGLVPPFDLARLGAGSHLVTRPTLGDFIADRTELLARAADVFGWVAAGRLRVAVSARFPLRDAAAAHRALESRRTTGKLLLVPD